MIRGEVYLANLNPVSGSEQGGYRPVLIIQNNVGNKYSPTVIVVPMTKQDKGRKLKTHVKIDVNNKISIVLCEQLRTLDKNRLRKYIGYINDNDKMLEINNAIALSVGL